MRRDVPYQSPDFPWLVEFSGETWLAAPESYQSGTRSDCIYWSGDRQMRMVLVHGDEVERSMTVQKVVDGRWVDNGPWEVRWRNGTFAKGYSVHGKDCGTSVHFHANGRLFYVKDNGVEFCCWDDKGRRVE